MNYIISPIFTENHRV